MAYWLRTVLFKGLSWLPQRLGDAASERIQEWDRRMTLEREFEAGLAAYRQLESLLATARLRLVDKTVLQVDSGRLPVLPYHLKYSGGCEKVLIYDRRARYRAKQVRALNEWFARRHQVQLQPASAGRCPLPAGIEYFPRTDLLQRLPRAGSIDIVVSCSLLERVRSAEIQQLHTALRPCLSEGGTLVHLVSARDHRADADPSLSPYDFLQYSEQEWRRRQTRFDYHNRLRLPEYLQLFEQSGLRALRVEFAKLPATSEHFRRFMRLKIHPEFARFSFEELTATALGFVLEPALSEVAAAGLAPDRRRVTAGARPARAEAPAFAPQVSPAV